MIRVTDINGHGRYLHHDNIAAITEAGASSQWHGVCSIVRCFDGTVIEAREKASDIATLVDSASKRSAGSEGV